MYVREEGRALSALGDVLADAELRKLIADAYRQRWDDASVDTINNWAVRLASSSNPAYDLGMELAPIYGSLTNRAPVIALYRDVYKVDPSQQTVINAAKMLDAGTPRSAVEQVIADSLRVANKGAWSGGIVPTTRTDGSGSVTVTLPTAAAGGTASKTVLGIPVKGWVLGGLALLALRR